MEKRYFSPAKINLFFHILGKREDGYHEIASLYQAIDLGDFLTISLSKEDKWSCSDPSIPPDLVFRAVSLFREKTSLNFSVSIEVEKKIPIEMGLGGGSSNAATTLWALNEQFGFPLSVEELSTLSGEIGADVPFFFSKGSAYCTSKGEKFSPFSLPHPFTGWLVSPFFGMKTPRVYKNVDLSLLSSRDLKEVLNSYKKGTFLFFNDLEISAFSLEPALIEMKKELYAQGCTTVCMTGSGSGFFCQSDKPITPPSNARLFAIKGIERKLNSWFVA